MKSSKCSVCGKTITAKTDSALKTALASHMSSAHKSTTNKKTVKQNSTTNGTSNEVNVSTYTVTVSNTSGGDITISNCIPVSNSTTVVDNYTDIKSIKNIKNNKPTQQVVKTSNNKDYGTEAIFKNSNKFPVFLSTNKDDGRNKYNYEIDMQNNICEAIKKIKKDLNVPSAYNRLELNKLFREKFNRFRIQYPDYFLNGTTAYVVMTRPDLNLFSTETQGELSYSTLLTQVLNDPQLYYIVNADIDAAKTLTKAYSSAHHFNPLLSNTLTSLDISDESIDTLETGETFTGFKTQYAKSNIRSLTAGTISLKFPETYNMAITHIHQLWCTYESSVYRGSLEPKSKYIWNKELDYACNIYYFLLDKEDMIIRYCCKYTGCFPLNVNKSVFSYDAGTELNHPELNVTYGYFAREDLSSIVLNEFNNDSGGISSGFKYRSNYIPSVDSYGSTWANAPFVEQITVPSGLDRDSKLYALRFRN